MYRRLKNLLGVSLIIFAILLSQIPMPSVQADNTGEEQVVVTFVYGMSGLSPSVEKLTVAKGSTLGIDAMEISVDGGSRAALTENTTYSINGAHYIFKGWCSESAEGSKWNFATDTVTKDVALYAIWDSVSDVEYDYEKVMNEAAVLADEDSAADTKNVVTVTFNFGLPTNCFGDTGNNMESDDGLAIIEVTQEVNESTGSLIVMEGTAVASYTPNSSHTIIVNRESISASLINWKTSENREWDFATSTVTKDITLYANWNLGDTQCTITYIADGAESNSKWEQTVTIGTNIPKPDRTPVRRGYSISAWVDDDNTKINWNAKVTGDMTIFANWEKSTYTVTFNLNGGSYKAENEFKAEPYVVSGEADTKMSDIIPDDVEFNYDGYETDVDWYTDLQCFTQYTSADTETIKDRPQLYKKWTKKTNGFTLSPSIGNNGEYQCLYEYELPADTRTDVVIPEGVTHIGPNAFSDMTNIRSITFPTSIIDIDQNAFSGMDNYTGETITILSKSTNTNATSYQKVNSLAKKYANKLKLSTVIPADSINIEVNSSSFASNSTVGEKNVKTYAKVQGSGIPKGNYQAIIMPNETNNTLKKLINSEDYSQIYYLDITLNDYSSDFSNEGYNEKTTNFIVTFPLPDAWQQLDLTNSIIHVFTSKSPGMSASEMEKQELTAELKEVSGIKCVQFKTWHFSPYVIALSETQTDDNDNSADDGSNNGNTSTDGGNSSSNGGSTTNGGSDTTTDSGGSSSGGGAGSDGSSGTDNGASSGSDSGSGSGGSSSSDSGSSGGSSSSSGTDSASSSASSSTGSNSQSAATTATDVTGTAAGAVQNVSTDNAAPSGTTAATNSSGNAHVKDATPKTGDPLEYRTLLVCGMFSLGVLCLLIGNKKKASSFSRYRRA